MDIPTLYIVVPCYNEEDCLPITSKKIINKIEELIKIKKISKKSRAVFVDDGSKDNTWKNIEELGRYSIGIKLSRNKGHQNALMAGLLFSKQYADITITIDADLQDDINIMEKMIDEYSLGNEVVYGVRDDRTTDSSFKRVTAQTFYKIMHLLGVDIVYNSADYRLLSRRVVEELSKYNESNLFLRGVIPSIGFKTATVSYKREKRIAGESKYPLKKMINFALEGITSFSIKPLRIILLIGIVISIVSFINLIILAIVSLKKSIDIGYFILSSVWLICGIQTTSIGIVGEYIGKTYLESKHRPRYSIEKIVNAQE